MENQQSILGDIKDEEIQSPYVRKMMMNIADGIIELIIIVALYLSMPQEHMTNLFSQGSYMKYLVTLTVIFAYRLICILLLGRTIGMILFKSKFLNKDLLPLSSKERLIAVFATKAKGIRAYKDIH